MKALYPEIKHPLLVASGRLLKDASDYSTHRCKSYSGGKVSREKGGPGALTGATIRAHYTGSANANLTRSIMWNPLA